MTRRKRKTTLRRGPVLALTALLLAVFLFLLFQGLKQNADEHQAPAAQASASQTDAQ